MLEVAVTATTGILNAIEEANKNFTNSSSSSSSSSSAFESKKSFEPWERHGGFLLYFALMCYVFCGFEVICDAFFVPALNVFCELMHMSEDFAGATLMGIGGNLPDIFSGIVGVCILHTDVGTGTIVGSLLFNHLCIIGFSVLFVKYIVLDLKCLIREVSFYAIAIILLFTTLYDHQVSIYESVTFLVVYIIYFFVCAFTPRIINLFNKCNKSKYVKVENPVAGSINEDVGDYTPVAIDSSESAESAEGTGNCEGSTFTDYVATEPDQSTEDSNNSTSSTSTAAVDSHDNVSAEPKSSSSSSSSSANPPEGAETTEVTAPAAETTAEAAPEAETTAEVAPEAVSPISPEEAAAKSLAERKENKEKLLKTFSTVFSSIIEQAKSSSGKEEVESGSNVGLPYGDVQMHGFLYKKSRWYTKVNISSQMWQRRWFVLGETFWYCRNPLYPDKNRREIPLWKAWKVSKSKEDPCVVEIYTKKQTYILRADEEENALRWAKALKERVKTVKKMHPELYSKAGLVDVDEEDDEDESLLEYPYGASTGRTIFWTITLPYSVLFTFTIPNVKKEKCKRMFPLTLIMVIVWLAIMSYAMIWGAQNFARSLSIPDDIMGVSITAIGASLPSLFGSIIAARQGSAKMAISNAFGANLCSILLALGIPCFIYSVSHHGHAFPCGSGAIFATVTVLFIALIVFLVIAAVWKLRLNYVHGIIFIILYAVLLAFIIVYNLPSLAL